MSELAPRDLLRDAAAHLHTAANTLCALRWSVERQGEFPITEAELREIAQRTTHDMGTLHRWSEVLDAQRAFTPDLQAPA